VARLRRLAAQPPLQRQQQLDPARARAHERHPSPASALAHTSDQRIEAGYMQGERRSDDLVTMA